jgi:hypothetical protein
MQYQQELCRQLSARLMLHLAMGRKLTADAQLKSHSRMAGAQLDLAIYIAHQQLDGRPLCSAVHLHADVNKFRTKTIGT